LISGSAFSGCTSLKSICISSGVQTLDEWSFCGCDHLASVTFERHSRLSRIEQWAFSSCPKLRLICLPAGLEHVGRGALNWPSLEHFRFEPGNRHFSVSESDFLVFKGRSIVGHIGLIGELVIERSIEELCDRSFCNRASLSAVSFAPDSRLRRIGEGAFMASSVRSIAIPWRVQTIGAKCCLGCGKLSIVKFESNSRLVAIGKFAFALCSLETVWIPSCIEAIALNHFGYCPDVMLAIIETGVRVAPYPKRLEREWEMYDDETAHRCRMTSIRCSLRLPRLEEIDRDIEVPSAMDLQNSVASDHNP
jgi:hypothetical protein